MMSEFWGKVHFWLSFIFMNLVFQPMFAQGMAGMHSAHGRRRFELLGGNHPDAIGGLPKIYTTCTR
jgi:heme/copper-type cytochrome/quinol oxidase subunit 1